MSTKRLLGAASAATIVAANGVVSYFTANACTTDPVLVVTDFQNAWNADQRPGSSSRLTVDGQYGPLTQGALESALGTTNVPANCFGGPAQPVPIDPPPSPGPLPPLPVGPPATQASSGSGPLPYIIGAVVVAGALAAYTYSNKKKGH